jgi:hypothetical protein
MRIGGCVISSLDQPRAGDAGRSPMLVCVLRSSQLCGPTLSICCTICSRVSGVCEYPIAISGAVQLAILRRLLYLVFRPGVHVTGNGDLYNEHFEDS